MDKIQVKMVELINNLSALEVCLAHNSKRADAERYGALILYLQWDMPLEDNDQEYAKLKRLYRNSRSLNIGYDTEEERYKALKDILLDFQDAVRRNERDGNQLTRVYGDAIKIADEICTRLDKQIKRGRVISSFSSVSTNFVPYPQKAAL